MRPCRVEEISFKHKIEWFLVLFKDVSLKFNRSPPPFPSLAGPCPLVTFSDNPSIQKKYQYPIPIITSPFLNAYY